MTILQLNSQCVFYKIYDIWKELGEWETEMQDILYDKEIVTIEEMVSYYVRKFQRQNTDFDDKCCQINQQLHPELFEYAQHGIALVLLCLVLEVHYFQTTQQVKHSLTSNTNTNNKNKNNLKDSSSLDWNTIFDEWYETKNIGIYFDKLHKDYVKTI